MFNINDINIIIYKEYQKKYKDKSLIFLSTDFI